jgi:hypothetical protein
LGRSFGQSFRRFGGLLHRDLGWHARLETIDDSVDHYGAGLTERFFEHVRRRSRDHDVLVSCGLTSERYTTACPSLGSGSATANQQ